MDCALVMVTNKLIKYKETESENVKKVLFPLSQLVLMSAVILL